MNVNNTMGIKHSSPVLHSNWHDLAYRGVHRLLCPWNRSCIIGCILNDILVLNDLMKFIANDNAANQIQQCPVELEVLCCLHLLGNEKILLKMLLLIGIWQGVMGVYVSGRCDVTCWRRKCFPRAIAMQNNNTPSFYCVILWCMLFLNSQWVYNSKYFFFTQKL